MEAGIGIAAFLIIQILGFAVWIAKLGQRVKHIEAMCEKYGDHGERIARIEGKMEPYVKRKSPLSLTKKGVALLEKSGAKQFIEHNRESLLEHFEKIDTPFDIQEEAERIMKEKLRENNDIKNYVFSTGEDMDNLATVAGIELRDLVIKHKGIEV